ncbi:peptidase S8/S53 domain-containing protein [Blakeslea trispora]|nr:peptidase S8/S53 domain-containing protein [Blakeslea trispora]
MKTPLFTFPGLTVWTCLALASLMTEAAEFKHAKLMNADSEAIAGRYIVQFKKDNSLVGKTFAHSVEQAISNNGIHIADTIHHRFFKGASIDISDVGKNALKPILDRPDVEAVYPVTIIRHASASGAISSTEKKASIEKRGLGNDQAADLGIPLALGQIDQVHSKLGYKGKGILVGIIDGGLDYLHPALGGGFGEGYKVVAGYDLVGDAFDFDQEPNPDEDPWDSCNTNENSISAHATHVAGIVAGYSESHGFTGVAPEASLGIWRVFGCQGSTTSEVMIKAMLMAYDAGVDVISMSISYPWGLYGYGRIESVIARQLIDKGVYFVNSAGNAGGSGLFHVGEPGRHHDLLSVGAMTNVFPRIGSFELTFGLNKTVEMFGSTTVYPKDGELVLGDTGIHFRSPGCDPEDIPDTVEGKVVVIRYGGCKIGRKAQMAASKGAISLIVYEDNSHKVNIRNENTVIPAVFVTQRVGEAIVETLGKGKKINIKFHAEERSMPILNKSTPASFSSLGPNSGLHLVPRISALGDNVNSTIPRRLGGYGFMYGTSMSTPYIAGSVALYLESIGKQKKRPFEEIIESLQNYALPAHQVDSSILDTPIRQGAGMVQLYHAITQSVHVSPSQISFNDTATTNYTSQTITITNHGSKAAKFDLKNDASISLTLFDEEGRRTPVAMELKTTAKLNFSKKSLNLSPGASQNLTITVTPPTKGAERYAFYGGYVRLHSKEQSSHVDVSIPYIGVNNDLSKIKGYSYY